MGSQISYILSLVVNFQKQKTAILAYLARLLITIRIARSGVHSLYAPYQVTQTHRLAVPCHSDPDFEALL